MTTRGWRALVGTLLVVLPLGVDLLLPSLPAIAATFSAPIATVQLTMTTYLVGLAIGQLVSGPVSDAVGRRLPLILGVLMVALGAMLAAGAPNIEVLLAARAVMGLGAGTLFVVASGVIRDRFDGVETAREISRATVVVSASAVVGPVLGSVILYFLGWRSVFGVIAVFLSFMAFVVIRFLPETLARPISEKAWWQRLISDALELVRDPQFLGYGGAVVLATAGLWALLATSSFLLQDHYGLTAQQYGLVLACSGVGLLALTQFTAAKVQQFGPRRMAIAGSMVMISGVGVIALGATIVDSMWCFVVGFGLYMTSLGLVVPCCRAMSVQSHQSRAGSGFALIGTTQFTLGALAAPVTGLLPMGQEVSSAVVALLLALATAGGLLLARPGRRTSASPT